MRKVILTAFLFGSALVANAQDGKKVRLGFKLDPTIFWLQPQESGVERNSSRFGVSFGLMTDFLLDEDGRYAIASGLQISTAGSTLKYEAGKGLDAYKQAPTEYKLKTTYVEVPFALKLKTDVENVAAFWGQFGTYLGVPVRSRANVVGLNVNEDKVNVLRNIMPVNIGLQVGAGVEYPLGDKLTGLVGLTYRNGFIDATRNGKWDDGKVNMNSFALNLGLFF
ncbi:porin family protein [Chitinophaga agri]|uniref:PorT family protein n=1 Tax=Chitinophaga agri TaxID=2703787 RepID=A0A6B9ZFQ0_9BACT|nr:porin family protein [Chitinophaga agri]QHS61210.1 PorT family protein [Chitinophaga agri]